MIHPDSELSFMDEVRGHGARAVAPIPTGTIVWTLCELDQVFTPGDVERMGPAYASVVHHFAYQDHNGDHVLCWDAGRYVNHSCRPTSRGLGPWAQIAVRDIEVGEEITCDYGECNIREPLSCACREPGCRGMIHGHDVVTLAATWDREISAALAHAHAVAQPLRPFWREPEWMSSVLARQLAPPSIAGLHFAGGSRRAG